MSLPMAVFNTLPHHFGNLTSRLHQVSIAYRLERNATLAFGNAAYLELLMAIDITKDSHLHSSGLAEQLGMSTKFCNILLQRGYRQQTIHLTPNGIQLTRNGKALTSIHFNLIHLVIQSLDQLAPSTIMSLCKLVTRLMKKKKKLLARRWTLTTQVRKQTLSKTRGYGKHTSVVIPLTSKP